MELCDNVPAASERWSLMAAGLANQPVERHKRGDSGKDGEQTVENNPCGDHEQRSSPVCLHPHNEND
jgi:hypothetical protein